MTWFCHFCDSCIMSVCLSLWSWFMRLDLVLSDFCVTLDIEITQLLIPAWNIIPEVDKLTLSGFAPLPHLKKLLGKKMQPSSKQCIIPLHYKSFFGSNFLGEEGSSKCLRGDMVTELPPSLVLVAIKFTVNRQQLFIIIIATTNITNIFIIINITNIYIIVTFNKTLIVRYVKMGKTFKI